MRELVVILVPRCHVLIDRRILGFLIVEATGRCERCGALGLHHGLCQRVGSTSVRWWKLLGVRGRYHSMCGRFIGLFLKELDLHLGLFDFRFNFIHLIVHFVKFLVSSTGVNLGGLLFSSNEVHSLHVNEERTYVFFFLLILILLLELIVVGMRLLNSFRVMSRAILLLITLHSDTSSLIIVFLLVFVLVNRRSSEDAVRCRYHW